MYPNFWNRNTVYKSILPFITFWYIGFAYLGFKLLIIVLFKHILDLPNSKWFCFKFIIPKKNITFIIHLHLTYFYTYTWEMRELWRNNKLLILENSWRLMRFLRTWWKGSRTILSPNGRTPRVSSRDVYFLLESSHPSLSPRPRLSV